MRVITACVVLCAMILTAKKALHMFQQNRYETGRLTKWIQESRQEVITLPGCVVSIAGIIAAFLLKEPLSLYVIMALCAIWLLLEVNREKHASYIKPLVYTARVKRQIAVLVLLAVICLCLVVFVPQAWTLAFCVPLAVFGPWALLYPMAWITSPIEAAVRRHYLNLAKDILKNRPDLIKIGITGSFGKTTTKNIMQAMVSEQYNSLMTPASYNTPMGITITIRQMLKPLHQVFVCEMGADHVGDITELMEFVHPTIGVVTSIGPQHLNTFGSQENITREKMQMIELLPKDGFGILNADNEFIRSYAIQNPVKTVTYAIHHDADYRAEDIRYTPTGSSFTVVYKDERIPMETKLLGELNILNILSAVAAARYLGIDWQVIRRAVRSMPQVEHRLELKKINGLRFIDDAFNANPVGSAMALEVLGMMPNTRIIVTPGMIDLGPKQEEINHAFGEKMKGKADVVILVGETQTRPIWQGLKDSGFDMENVLVMKTVKDAFAWLWAHGDPTGTILLENDLPDAFNH